jgi:ABC-type antimicrobial peptide transport system permease subunit
VFTFSGLAAGPQLADTGAGDRRGVAAGARVAVASGVFFDDASVARADKVVVLGAGVRDQLFGTSADPTGQVVRIANQPFRVVGVMARKGQPAMGQDQDDAVFVPYTAVQKRIQGVRHVSSIMVLVSDGNEPERHHGGGSRPSTASPSARVGGR